jgi:hypothetical protein
MNQVLTSGRQRTRSHGLLTVPARMHLILRRWVSLGTIAADGESLISRHTGGRV